MKLPRLRDAARRSTAGLAVATAVAAVALVGPGAGTADAAVIISGPGLGTGTAIANCSVPNHSIAVHLNQTQMAGPVGQSIQATIYVYAYVTAKWYTVYTGGPAIRDNTGQGYYSWQASGLPGGQYAVYATFWWYTTTGWVSSSTYALYSQWNSSYYKSFDSSTCYA